MSQNNSLHLFGRNTSETSSSSLASAIFGSSPNNSSTTNGSTHSNKRQRRSLFDVPPPPSPSPLHKKDNEKNAKTQAKNNKSKSLITETKLPFQQVMQRRRAHAQPDMLQQSNILVQAPSENEKDSIPREIQLEEIADDFRQLGVCVIPQAVPCCTTSNNNNVLEDCSRAANEILQTITARVPDIATQIVRYQEVATRCRGRMDTRYQTSMAPFNDAAIFDANDTLQPLIELLLGPSAVLVYAGLIFNFPDSDNQPWHQDGEPLFPELLSQQQQQQQQQPSLLVGELPPYAINVFLPLDDQDGALEAGPTEFVPGSHVLPVEQVMSMIEEYEKATTMAMEQPSDNKQKMPSVAAAKKEQDNDSDSDSSVSSSSSSSSSSSYSNVAQEVPVVIGPRLQQGDALLYDYRICHRGTSNLTHQTNNSNSNDSSKGRVRRILYLMYARPWFKEHLNFGTEPLFSS